MANQQHFFSFMASPPDEMPVVRTHHPTPVRSDQKRGDSKTLARGKVQAEGKLRPPQPTTDDTANEQLPRQNEQLPRQNEQLPRQVEPIGHDALDPPTAPLDPPTAPPSRDAVLTALRAKVGCVTTSRQDDGEYFSTGCEALDQWLPVGGLHPSTLTEWIAAHDSAAAGSLAISAAAQRLRQIPGRPLVIVDCEGSFYPPAAVALGIPAEQMILLRPRSGADAIWAIDQSLRSGAVAAVWACLPMQVDDRDARRLQLAAETGRTPGLLVRGFAARGKPSFAEVQFYVSQRKRPTLSTQRRVLPQASTAQLAERRSRDFEVISVTLDRVRGGVVGRQLDVQLIDSGQIRPLSSTTTRPHTKRHETAAEHLASQLAHPASAKRVATRRGVQAAS